MHIKSGVFFQHLKNLHKICILSVNISNVSSLHISPCADLEEEGSGQIYIVKLPKICLGLPWKTLISLRPSQGNFSGSVHEISCSQYLSTFQVYTFVPQYVNIFSAYISPSFIVCQQFKCIHMYRICQHIQLVKYLSSFQGNYMQV